MPVESAVSNCTIRRIGDNKDKTRRFSILSLVVVFLLAVLVEWLSNCNYIKECSCSWTATLPESLERKRQPTERIYIPGLSYRGQPKKRTRCSYPRRTSCASSCDDGGMRFRRLAEWRKIRSEAVGGLGSWEEFKVRKQAWEEQGGDMIM
nr:copper transporter 6-like [Ipomoea batatas]